MNMRVLMIRRNNAQQVEGGDSIRFGYMQEFLSRDGVEVSLCSEDTLPEDANYNLVHLSNLQTEKETEHVYRWAKQRNLLTVLSPIFWDMTELEFIYGKNRKAFWRFMSRWFPQIGVKLYEIWQSLNRWRQTNWNLRRKLLESVDWLLPTSDIEITHLEKQFRLLGKLRCKSTVVYSGVDASIFKNPKRSSGIVYKRLGIQEYILQVSRIEPAKNQLNTIKALYDLDIPLVFVGKISPYDLKYAEQCKDLAKKCGNVYFIGFLPQDLLVDVYATASVHILPSWRETPGLASLEAAASGCPIVSTSIGCAQEYFGSMAQYCHPGDIKSIRNAIEAALHSERNYELRRYTLANFTWERAAQKTMQGYTQALDKSQPRTT